MFHDPILNVMWCVREREMDEESMAQTVYEKCLYKMLIEKNTHVFAAHSLNSI